MGDFLASWYDHWGWLWTIIGVLLYGVTLVVFDR